MQQTRRPLNSGAGRKHGRVAVTAAATAVLAAGAGLALNAWLQRPVHHAGLRAPAVTPIAFNAAWRRPLRILLHRASGGSWATVRLGAPGTATATATGKKLGLLPAAALMISADPAHGRVLVTGPGVSIWQPEVRLASDSGVIRVGARRYRGAIIARLAGAGVALINEVPLERYLEGVLPGELPASFAPEAQKALAVAARTYALRNLGKHAAEGADLCDGVHCQMYLGDTNASPPGRNAVRATQGLCAWYQGDLVCTFYSADCGGESTSAANVPLPDMPRRPPPYLRPVRDRPRPGAPDYCCASPSHWWSAQVSLARLQALLDATPQTWLGTLKSVAFVARDVSGRVTRVRLTGAGPSLDPAVPVVPIVRTMSGWEFRRLAGPRRIRSTLMRIAANDGKALRITGTGNGHGLGLCQIGANGMAKAHHTFRQILLHYYPGIDVAPIPLPAARAHGPAAG